VNLDRVLLLAARGPDAATVQRLASSARREVRGLGDGCFGVRGGGALLGLASDGAPRFGSGSKATLALTAVRHYIIDGRLADVDAMAVEPETIVTAKCDALSRNALGASLDGDTIPRLQARVIAGAAASQPAPNAAV
jgi:hypothetical protein